MIYSIEEINQRTPRLLPNLTLGYDIYDTCGDVNLAIIETLQLMKNQSDPKSCLLPEHIDLPLRETQTKAVIGERYSEVSTAVARVLALTSVAQVCLFSAFYFGHDRDAKCNIIIKTKHLDVHIIYVY